MRQTAIAMGKGRALQRRNKWEDAMAFWAWLVLGLFILTPPAQLVKIQWASKSWLFEPQQH
jgi:hypothetical protein